MSKKITQLTAVDTLATSDVFPIVDISAGETKKATVAQILALVPAATPTPPATPARSVQFEDSGAFNGASDVKISSSGENLELGHTLGTVASAGTVRTAMGPADDVNGFTWYARGNARDVLVHGSYITTLSGTPREFLTWGGYGGASIAPYVQRYYAQNTFGMSLTTSTPQGSKAGYTLFMVDVAGPIGGWSHRAVIAIERHTNLVMMGTLNSLANPDDQIGGGEQVIGFAPSETRPTAAPTVGIVLDVDSNNRGEYLRSNGEWVPLWDGPEKVVSTTGAINDLSTLDSAGLPVSVIKFTGSNPSLTGLTDGREGRSISLQYEGDTGLIVNSQNVGSVAANRIIALRTTQWITNAQAIRVTWDTNVSRWRYEGIPVAPTGSADDIVSINSNGQLKSAGSLASLVAKESQTVTYASDADKTLSISQSLAEALIIAAGTLTAGRNLTSLTAAGVTARQWVRNLNTQNISFGWASGTRVTINGGGTNWAYVGCVDGANAVVLASGT